MPATRPARRFTRQPDRPMGIDWTNPRAVGLKFATYAGSASHFFDMVACLPMHDPYAADASFKFTSMTHWGRGRSTGGGGYRNSSPRTVITTQGRTGRQTMLALVRPRAATPGNDVYFAQAGDTASWHLNSLTLNTGGYFGAKHANGPSILADAPYTVGEHYAVAMVNQSSLDEAQYQHLYINGAKQAAESASSSTSNKRFAVVDLTSAGNNALDIFAVFVWDRTLTEAEIREVSANPYQLFDQRGNMFKATSSTTEFTYIDTVGSSVGGATATSIARAVASAYGSSAAQAIAAASAQSVAQTTAMAQGASTASAVAFTVTQTFAQAVGSSTVQSTAVTVACASGSSTGSATVTGNAACVWQVVGSSGGVATVNAISAFGTSEPENTVVFFDTQGASYGNSTAAAEARAVANAFGSAIGASLVTATAHALTSAIGSALASATVAGTGAMVITTTGAAVAASSASATANAVTNATGASTSEGSAQAVCLTVYESVASSLSTSEVQAVTQTVINTIANSNGLATVTGTTEGGVHYTASGDQFSVTITFAPYSVTVENKPYTVTFN